MNLCYGHAMFGAFNELVEQRIREAMRKGEFQGLDGDPASSGGGEAVRPG